ncbi:uncharacterized protein LOC132032132 [Lycium ferocissimum]|uniref:uncharacterized protein LOC132032132 n=1 Tax=Lycium ferocissimum TaxID=112874 RepID=UPI00281513A0|nr:uncharacterized protein LOC132032132 [Lycium ferocissimum]
MAPYEALYGRRYRSPIGWFEPTEVELLGPNSVHEAIEKLPSDMAMVHPVFHVSMLRLYKPDPSYVLNHEQIEINEGLTYEEKPVQILDRQVRRLRTKDVASVKVLWRNHNTEKATWEAEEDMKKRYPHLFPMGGMS